MARSDSRLRSIATAYGDPRVTSGKYGKLHHWPYPQRISPSALETPEKKRLFLTVFLFRALSRLRQLTSPRHHLNRRKDREMMSRSGGSRLRQQTIFG